MTLRTFDPYRLAVEFEPRAGLRGAFDRGLVRRAVERTMQRTVGTSRAACRASGAAAPRRGPWQELNGAIKARIDRLVSALSHSRVPRRRARPTRVPRPVETTVRRSPSLLSPVVPQPVPSERVGGQARDARSGRAASVRCGGSALASLLDPLESSSHTLAGPFRAKENSGASECHGGPGRLVTDARRSAPGYPQSSHPHTRPRDGRRTAARASRQSTSAHISGAAADADRSRALAARPTRASAAPRQRRPHPRDRERDDRSGLAASISLLHEMCGTTGSDRVRARVDPPGPDVDSHCRARGGTIGN
jgi:hypothetical protein